MAGAEDIHPKHTRAIEELLFTERVYLSDLKDILFGYLRNIPEKVLSWPEKAVIFGNIESLFAFQQTFAARLEKCTAMGPEHIASAFLDMDFENLYSIYCTNQPYATQFLISKQDDEELQAILASCRTTLGHRLDLIHYLCKPTQRILKYALLLQAQLERSSESWKGYENLNKATAKMAQVCERVNESKREKELSALFYGSVVVTRSQGLSNRFTGLPDDLQLPSLGSLINEDSSFVDMGETKAGKKPPAGSYRALFLFERALIVCKERPDRKLAIKHLLYFSQWSIKAADEHTLCCTMLQSSSTQHSYFSQLVDARRWESQIARAMSGAAPTTGVSFASAHAQGGASGGAAAAAAAGGAAAGVGGGSAATAGAAGKGAATSGASGATSGPLLGADGASQNSTTASAPAASGGEVAAAPAPTAPSKGSTRGRFRGLFKDKDPHRTSQPSLNAAAAPSTASAAASTVNSPNTNTSNNNSRANTSTSSAASSPSIVFTGPAMGGAAISGLSAGGIVGVAGLGSPPLQTQPQSLLALPSTSLANSFAASSTMSLVSTSTTAATATETETATTSVSSINPPPFHADQLSFKSTESDAVLSAVTSIITSSASDAGGFGPAPLRRSSSMPSLYLQDNANAKSSLPTDHSDVFELSRCRTSTENRTTLGTQHGRLSDHKLSAPQKSAQLYGGSGSNVNAVSQLQPSMAPMRTTRRSRDAFNGEGSASAAGNRSAHSLWYRSSLTALLGDSSSTLLLVPLIADMELCINTLKSLTGNLELSRDQLASQVLHTAESIAAHVSSLRLLSETAAASATASATAPFPLVRSGSARSSSRYSSGGSTAGSGGISGSSGTLAGSGKAASSGAVNRSNPRLSASEEMLESESALPSPVAKSSGSIVPGKSSLGSNSSIHNSSNFNNSTPSISTTNACASCALDKVAACESTSPASLTARDEAREALEAALADTYDTSSISRSCGEVVEAVLAAAATAHQGSASGDQGSASGNGAEESSAHGKGGDGAQDATSHSEPSQQHSGTPPDDTVVDNGLTDHDTTSKAASDVASTSPGDEAALSLAAVDPGPSLDAARAAEPTSANSLESAAEAPSGLAGAGVKAESMTDLDSSRDEADSAAESTDDLMALLPDSTPNLVRSAISRTASDSSMVPKITFSRAPSDGVQESVAARMFNASPAPDPARESTTPVLATTPVPISPLDNEGNAAFSLSKAKVGSEASSGEVSDPAAAAASAFSAPGTGDFVESGAPVAAAILSSPSRPANLIVTTSNRELEQAVVVPAATRAGAAPTVIKSVAIASASTGGLGRKVTSADDMSIPGPRITSPVVDVDVKRPLSANLFGSEPSRESGVAGTTFAAISASARPTSPKKSTLFTPTSYHSRSASLSNLNKTGSAGRSKTPSAPSSALASPRSPMLSRSQTAGHSATGLPRSATSSPTAEQHPASSPQPALASPAEPSIALEPGSARANSLRHEASAQGPSSKHKPSSKGADGRRHTSPLKEGEGHGSKSKTARDLNLSGAGPGAENAGSSNEGKDKERLSASASANNAVSPARTTASSKSDALDTYSAVKYAERKSMITSSPAAAAPTVLVISPPASSSSASAMASPLSGTTTTAVSSASNTPTSSTTSSPSVLRHLRVGSDREGHDQGPRSGSPAPSNVATTTTTPSPSSSSSSVLTTSSASSSSSAKPRMPVVPAPVPVSARPSSIVSSAPNNGASPSTELVAVYHSLREDYQGSLNAVANQLENIKRELAEVKSKRDHAQVNTTPTTTTPAGGGAQHASSSSASLSTGSIASSSSSSSSSTSSTLTSSTSTSTTTGGGSTGGLSSSGAGTMDFSILASGHGTGGGMMIMGGAPMTPSSPMTMKRMMSSGFGGAGSLSQSWGGGSTSVALPVYTSPSILPGSTVPVDAPSAQHFLIHQQQQHGSDSDSPRMSVSFPPTATQPLSSSLGRSTSGGSSQSVGISGLVGVPPPVSVSVRDMGTCSTSPTSFTSPAGSGITGGGSSFSAFSSTSSSLSSSFSASTAMSSVQPAPASGPAISPGAPSSSSSSSTSAPHQSSQAISAAAATVTSLLSARTLSALGSASGTPSSSKKSSSMKSTSSPHQS